MMREVVLGFPGLDDTINAHVWHQTINHNCWLGHHKHSWVLFHWGDQRAERWPNLFHMKVLFQMMREVVLGFLGLDHIINTHHWHQMINHNCQLGHHKHSWVLFPWGDQRAKSCPNLSHAKVLFPMMREVVLEFPELDDIINPHHWHQMINHNGWLGHHKHSWVLFHLGGSMGQFLTKFVPREGPFPNDEGGCLRVSGT